jgi:ATP-dependent helicase HrpA
VIVVVAFLSIQDPRERPAEKTEAADKAHAAWRDPESDFLGHLLLWNAVMSQPSQSKRNRFCRSHFLHPGRVREWINLVDDLRSTCQDHRWEIPASIGEMEVLDPEGLHRSLLAGVPRLVGQREEKREFRGPTGQLFQVFPGSALASKPPKWIMSFSLVETSRIWARECARLQPEWLERVAPHLCKAHYERPVWNEKRGFVEAEERLQFGQLTLRHGTRVHYGRIDPAEARRIFIEDGLCPARLPLQDNVLAPYRAFLNSLQHWENKLRRPGAFTESSALAAHVDRILPKDIFTAKAFGRWSRNVDWIPSPNDLLQVESLDPEGLPDTLQVGGVMVGLDYAVAPENPEVDGVTFVVRDTDLPQVPSELVEWTAPAWLAEKTEGLIRSLEKRLRNRCHPISATASEALAWMKEEGFLFTHSMTGALAAFLAARLDCILAAPDLNPEALPPHLRSRLRVVNAEGSVIYEGGSSPDRSRIEREQTDPHAGDSLTGWEGRWQDWPPGELPPQVDSPQGRRFPAVTCSWPDLVVRLYRSEAEAQDAALTALTAYFRQKYPDPVRYLQKQFPLSTHLQLSLSLEKAVGDSALEDVQNAVLRQALSDGGPAPRSHEDAIQRCDHARSVLFEVAERICQQLELVFTLRSGVQEKIASLSPGPLRTDLEFQQQLMWRAGWCMDPVCLERYPSYLKGIEVRIERALRNPAKDLQKFREMEPALDAFAGIADQCTPAQTGAALLQLEELRLALFSPEIKTSGKASPQRFLRWLENL